jgi:hypothetical protein
MLLEVGKMQVHVIVRLAHEARLIGECVLEPPDEGEQRPTQSAVLLGGDGCT